MSAIALSAALIGLSAQCAATVAPGTLLTFARAESGLDQFALHDNSTGASLRPQSKAQAMAVASQLVASGHSVDLGLLQINSRNLAWLGLSISDAFELCPSIAAGARVLHTSYDPCVDAGGEAQTCLRSAASAYNTGSPTRGFANGYVRRIADTAVHFIPEIRVAALRTPESAPVPSPPPAAPPCAPSWDAWALATCRAAPASPSVMEPDK